MQFGVVARVPYSEVSMPEREAYLLPEYAPWYVGVATGTWLPAAAVAELVREQLLRGEPRWATGPRLLDAEHFRFRGGSEDARPACRTRQGDPSSPPPRIS